MANEYNLRNFSEGTIERPLNTDDILDSLPILLIFTIACAFGIFGNHIVVKFYGLTTQPNTSTTFLIKALGWTDGIVCVSLYMSIVEFILNIGSHVDYIYISRTIGFLYYWIANMSLWLLGWIAVDRYRKICQPHKPQMTVRFAKRSTLFLIIWSFLLSLKSLVLNAVILVNIEEESVNGTKAEQCQGCTIATEDPSLAPYVQAINLSDTLLFAGLILTYLTLYSLITYKLIKQRQLLKNWQADNKSKNDVQETVHDEGAVKPVATISEKLSENETVPSDASSRPVKKKEKIQKSEVRITIMMIIVSVTCVVIFSVYFMSRMLLRAAAESNPSLDWVSRLMLRVVGINNIVNPVIYYIYNEKFREFTKSVLMCKTHPPY